MRHGEAEDNPPGFDDHWRRLSNRGCVEAKSIGTFLRKHDIIPQIILASDSWRTDETASIVGAQVQYPESDIIREQFLYYCYTTEELLEYVAGLDDSAGCLLIVGHNPYIAYAAYEMSKTPITHFPTAACAIYDFDVSKWADIRPKEGSMRIFVTPKTLKFKDK